MKSIELTSKLILFLLCISTSSYKLAPAAKIVSLLCSCLSHRPVLIHIRQCSLHVSTLFLTYFKLNNIYMCTCICIYFTFHLCSYFLFFKFFWRIIALQNFVVFCQTSSWIYHRYTCIPSLLNIPPISCPISPL